MTTAAEQKQPGTELTVVQRASLALGAAEHEKKLIALAKQSTEIVAITNPAGLQQCHGARMTLKNERINLEKLGKAARDDATKFSKAVIEEERRLVGLIHPEELRLEAIQDAHNAEVARKKEEAAHAERERVDRIQAGIRDLRNALIDVAGRNSGVIDDKIRELVGHDISEATCQEFKAEAEAAREATLAKLRDMRAAALAHEQEAARLAAERADLERRQAEQAERERLERERADSELKRIADEQAHLKKVREAEEAERHRKIEEEERASRERIEAQERQARALREQADREAQALRDAEVARLKAIQDRIDAEKRALEERQRQEREEIEAKAKAERDAQDERDRQERLALEAREREERLAAEAREREERVARETAEREALERQEAEQRARDDAEREAREAEEARQREEQRKANELLDGRELLATFRGRFAVHPEFAGVIKAIDAYLQPRAPNARGNREQT